MPLLQNLSLNILEGNIKWLVSGDIHKGYIHDCEGRITDEGMSSSNCKVLPIDSVMIALNGQGKTRATVALLKTEATCNQSLVAMKPFMDNSALSEYIYYLLKGKYFQIREITGQKERRGLNMTLVSQLPIALPPLEEQKAIVEVVKTLFAEVEELESLNKERLQLKESFVVSALNKLTEAKNTQQEWNFLQQHFSSFFTEKKNIKSLRETILQFAVQGKLTTKWREENPCVEHASELLKRIEAEKQQLIAENKIKTTHKLHRKAKKEASFKVPKSWECRRFWDVIWCFRGHNPPKSEFIDKPREGYVRFVQITDFKTDLKAVYVPETHKLKRVKKGEILMAAYRHIGKLSRRMEGAFNVALCKINCIKPFDINFLELLIGTPIVKGELLSESERGHIPSMHSDHLLSLWIPIPPLEEQQIIVEKVNSLMVLCDELEQQTENSQTQIEQLMQSCLKEVF